MHSILSLWYAPTAITIIAALAVALVYRNEFRAPFSYASGLETMFAIGIGGGIAAASWFMWVVCLILS